MGLLGVEDHFDETTGLRTLDGTPIDAGEGVLWLLLGGMFAVAAYLYSKGRIH